MRLIVHNLLFLLKRFRTSSILNILGYLYPISNVFEIGKSIRCYADRFYHTVINYDGKVYKCTAYLNQEVGVLHDNGVITWNNNIISNLYSKATFENEKCLACKHLPICLGTCIQKTKDFKCMMDYSAISYEQFIINMYEHKIEMNNK